jgi:hypothetical protein
MKHFYWASYLWLSLGVLEAHADSTPLGDYNGQCGVNSHIAQGRKSEDLSKLESRYFCDQAIVGSEDGTDDHVRITFKKDGQTISPVIAVIGVKKDGDMIHLRDILMGSQRAEVNDGACRFFYTKKRQMTDIVCSATFDQGEQRTVSVIAFKLDQK